MLAEMKSGSVIIDLAAATGGNTPVTKNNETIYFNGICIVGNSNLQSELPRDASKLYGKNITNFIELMIVNNSLTFEDELVKNSSAHMVK